MEYQKEINYKAQYTACKFHQSNSFVRLFMGPVGSGKTTACIMEILDRAKRQLKSVNGIRYSRWIVVRNTYPELKTTTIKSWEDWLPPEIFGDINYGSPFKHHLRFDDVDLEVIFLAADKPKDIAKLLSLETTGIWLNEARELPKAILDAATARCGRYPSHDKGKPSWYGVIADTNPPDDDHWIYKLFEEESHADYEIFKAPAGLLMKEGNYILNPVAENINNLPPAYYEKLIKGKSLEWIKVFVMNEYGTVADGKPIYPEYNDNLHISEDLHALPNVPLQLNWDFGLTPACLITQMTPNGQLRVLDELQATRSGIASFAKNIVLPFIQQKYIEFHFEEGQADPAGLSADTIDNELSCIGVLNNMMIDHPAFNTVAASTNKFEIRQNAVSNFLTRLVDGEPAIIISSRCKILRKGLLGNYRYKRLAVSGEERYKDEPDKQNIYSHLQDCLQYSALKYLSEYRKDNITDIVDNFYNSASQAQTCWGR